MLVVLIISGSIVVLLAMIATIVMLTQIAVPCYCCWFSFALLLSALLLLLLLLRLFYSRHTGKDLEPFTKAFALWPFVICKPFQNELLFFFALPPNTSGFRLQKTFDL